MGANLDVIPAITLANRNKKARVRFFINQARLSGFIVNVFRKNGIGALIVITLDPEQRGVIARPL